MQEHVKNITVRTIKSDFLSLINSGIFYRSIIFLLLYNYIIICEVCQLIKKSFHIKKQALPISRKCLFYIVHEMTKFYYSG